MEAAFGESSGIEGSRYGGRGGGREDFGADGGVLYVVEGEASPVWALVFGVEDGAQVAGGHAGLEDHGGMGLGDAPSVVDDGDGPVSAVFQGGSHEDVAGPGVAGVAEQLEESVLDVGDGRGAAARSLCAREAGEARAEVAVWALYLATSLTRLSRMTVTLIWPGYSRSLSICLEMS